MSKQDEQIVAEIRQRLALNPELDPREIRISVEGGFVTLGGPVRSRHEKKLAEQAAAEVRGVVEVDNQLRVVGPGEATERGLQGPTVGGDERPPLDPRGGI